MSGGWRVHRRWRRPPASELKATIHHSMCAIVGYYIQKVGRELTHFWLLGLHFKARLLLLPLALIRCAINQAPGRNRTECSQNGHHST